MKQDSLLLPRIHSYLKNKVNLLYILAFVPLVIIFFYSPMSVIIPVYGFILLYFKNQKLHIFKSADFIQEIVGLVFIISSFFVYCVLGRVFPDMGFYGGANYFVYLFGLFLVFFELSALKEAFAPLFLIAAAISTSQIELFLKPYLAPYSNDFAHLIAGILNTLGIHASISPSSDLAILSFHSIQGITGAFVYECIGVYSALTFSIILVVVLFEDQGDLKAKLPFAVVGVLGTFILNIGRVTGIFVTDYFYGAEVGGKVHYVIGYILFSAWIVCFLYLYSKRQTVSAKIQSFWQEAILHKETKISTIHGQ